jgi:hypothetical protein
MRKKAFVIANGGQSAVAISGDHHPHRWISRGQAEEIVICDDKTKHVGPSYLKLIERLRDTLEMHARPAARSYTAVLPIDARRIVSRFPAGPLHGFGKGVQRLTKSKRCKKNGVERGAQRLNEVSRCRMRWQQLPDDYFVWETDSSPGIA